VPTADEIAQEVFCFIPIYTHHQLHHNYALCAGLE
jgi:hypothetical protein